MGDRCGSNVVNERCCLRPGFRRNGLSRPVPGCGEEQVGKPAALERYPDGQALDVGEPAGQATRRDADNIHRPAA